MTSFQSEIGLRLENWATHPHQQLQLSRPVGLYTNLLQRRPIYLFLATCSLIWDFSLLSYDVICSMIYFILGTSGGPLEP